MKNGNDGYVNEESERKGVAKVNESQLRSIIAESVKRVLSESFARPSEGTLMKAKELYDYLYDVQDESDATSALYKMISDWLNEQYTGEMNAAIGG